MSAEHTPGRLKVVVDEHPHYLGGKHVERRIFTELNHSQTKEPVGVVNISIGIPEKIDGPIATHFVSISEPDARRLVACWNACQGISTEGIEAITALGGMTHKMPVAAGLVRQRDDLLSALREIAETSTDPGAVACASAAIAKVGAAS